MHSERVTTGIQRQEVALPWEIVSLPVTSRADENVARVEHSNPYQGQRDAPSTLRTLFRSRIYNILQPSVIMHILHYLIRQQNLYRTENMPIGRTCDNPRETYTLDRKRCFISMFT